MAQLEGLNNRVSRIEQKLQPINNDRAEARAMIGFCTDGELAAMSVIYDAAARRLGVTVINQLEPDMMLAAEITLFEDIEQRALARKATGQLPYSVLQRC